MLILTGCRSNFWELLSRKCWSRQDLRIQDRRFQISLCSTVLCAACSLLVLNLRAGVLSIFISTVGKNTSWLLLRSTNNHGWRSQISLSQMGLVARWWLVAYPQKREQKRNNLCRRMLCNFLLRCRLLRTENSKYCYKTQSSAIHFKINGENFFSSW